MRHLLTLCSLMMTPDEIFMGRCMALAKLGAGNVAPNPMVGAVLVYKNQIIGEGYHQKYGEAHAEVNCIESVNDENKKFISQSTLFVSLEPCNHFGKTPPCTDLIIKNKIQKVVIGCRDPFKEINGKGVEKLKTAGVQVKTGIREQNCLELNKRFITFHTQHRPYIILKWAQTQNRKISSNANHRLHITNDFTNRLVHKWRSEEAAILVGTNTAMTDNPQLTTRLWKGKNPVRAVVDMNLKLPPSVNLFNVDSKTIVFNKVKQQERENILFYQVTDDVNLLHQIINAFYQLKIISVIVEGGAMLLQSFIEEGMWDEARIITNEKLRVENGLPAPVLNNAIKKEEAQLSHDRIEIFERG